MGASDTVRSLRARLRSLEDAAGKGRRNCAYCRLNVQRLLPGQGRPEPGPEEAVRAECEYCGSAFWVSLSGCSERGREIIRLVCTFTPEDIFTDPKAYALHLWLDPGRDCLKGARGAAGGAATPKGARRRNKLAELTARHDRLRQDKYQRLVAKYCEDPFPELTAQAETILHEAHEDHDAALLPRGHSHRPEFNALEQGERQELVRAAMERVIFGRVWPETEENIANIKTRIDELLEWPRSQARREEEREARRREEEERRLEEDARRREEEAARLRERDEERRREEETIANRRKLLRESFPPGISDKFIDRFLEERQ